MSYEDCVSDEDCNREYHRSIASTNRRNPARYDCPTYVGTVRICTRRIIDGKIKWANRWWYVSRENGLWMIGSPTGE
jgi:hypothetical protein